MHTSFSRTYWTHTSKTIAFFPNVNPNRLLTEAKKEQDSQSLCRPQFRIKDLWIHFKYKSFLEKSDLPAFSFLIACFFFLQGFMRYLHFWLKFFVDENSLLLDMWCILCLKVFLCTVDSFEFQKMGDIYLIILNNHMVSKKFYFPFFMSLCCMMVIHIDFPK